jgi:hypothetical protein
MSLFMLCENPIEIFFLSPTDELQEFRKHTKLASSIKQTLLDIRFMVIKILE